MIGTSVINELIKLYKWYQIVQRVTSHWMILFDHHFERADQQYLRILKSLTPGDQ